MKYGMKLLTLVCLVAAGCDNPPKVAVAIATPQLTSQSGTFAPTVPIRGSDGRITTLQAAANEVYVVAFVPAADSSGCGIDPRVSKLANRLWDDSVSVIQLTEPGSTGSLAVTGPVPCLPPRNGILVLDPDRIAWSAFGSPPLGTVLLIDPHGEIIGEGDLDHTDSIRWCATGASLENRHTQEYLIFTGQTDGRVDNTLNDWD
jgi:hypothetical protein